MGLDSAALPLAIFLGVIVLAGLGTVPVWLPYVRDWYRSRPLSAEAQAIERGLRLGTGLAAADALVAGDHRPFRDLVLGAGSTRLRDHWLTTLAPEASIDTLCAWVDEAPGQVEPLLARALLAEHLGWQARGREGAESVSREGWELLHTWMEAAEVDLAAARAMNPEDPLAWCLSLRILLPINTEELRDEIDLRFEEALARDALNLDLHAAWLQFNAMKWGGSHEEMFEVANAAADAAPSGHELKLLPFRAWAERWMAERCWSAAAEKGAQAAWDVARAVLQEPSALTEMQRRWDDWYANRDDMGGELPVDTTPRFVDWAAFCFELVDDPERGKQALRLMGPRFEAWPWEWTFNNVVVARDHVRRWAGLEPLLEEVSGGRR